MQIQGVEVECWCLVANASSVDLRSLRQRDAAQQRAIEELRRKPHPLRVDVTDWDGDPNDTSEEHVPTTITGRREQDGEGA